MPKMAKICYFCLKSGILCPKCQEKVRSGEVTELDLKVGRLLLSLEKDFPTLQDVELVKAIDIDDILVIIVGRGDMPRMLSYGGKIVKTLEKKIGKRVRILEQGSSDRKFLEDLFAPLDVLTINRIWLPDGTMETRVILRGRRRGLPIPIRMLREIAQKIRGMTLRVEFAR